MSDDYLLNPGFDPSLGSLPADGAERPSRKPAVEPPAPERSWSRSLTSGASPSLQDLGCGICRATPVAEFFFTEQVGFVLALDQEVVGGRLCRNCALAVGRRAQSKSVGLGWFGLRAIFYNIGTVFKNAVMLRRVGSLPPPSSANESTLSPGRPSWLRVGMIAPLVATAFVSYSLVDNSRNPTTPVEDVVVGQCVDDPQDGGFDRFNVRPCYEPHDMEIYAVAALGDGLRSDFAKRTFCVEELEEYIGQSLLQSDLDIAYFAPERRTAGNDEPVICALYLFDGSQLTVGRRAAG